MKARLRVLPAVILAALLPACNSNNRDDTNPFAQNVQSVPPADSAALIFTSSLYSLDPTAGREIFGVNLDGSGLARLTFCNNSASPCDYAEAAPAPDRERVGARRVSVDSNGDAIINEADGAALVFLDLRRGVEAALVPAGRRVSGVDWAPSSGDFLIYSALPAGGGNEDLFTISYNGQDDQNLTCTAQATSQCDVALRERRPRLDQLESLAIFQRVSAAGASSIALFQSPVNQPAITNGPNDADPVLSPDGRRVAFRRLTDASANGGQGNWDILTVALDGTGLASVASGPVFRGGPDWSPDGLAWAEADASGQRLMVAAPDGTSLRAIVTQPTNVTLTNPRWLQPK
jgi:hypothetical protein